MTNHDGVSPSTLLPGGIALGWHTCFLFRDVDTPLLDQPCPTAVQPLNKSTKMRTYILQTVDLFTGFDVVWVAGARLGTQMAGQVEPDP